MCFMLRPTTQVTSRRCKGTTLEDAEGFPEVGELEPIEIEEFEEVEFESKMQLETKVPTWKFGQKSLQRNTPHKACTHRHR